LATAFVAATLPLLAPAIGFAPSSLSAQQPATDAVPVLSETPTGVTPGGAFLRSILLPGWGHVATESYTRAGFYVAAQSGSLWMLLQTLERRGEADARLRIERERVSDRLQILGPPASEADSAVFFQAIASDPGVQTAQKLVDARDDQVEDWSALSIFLVLLGATDAFVAAHLADFPEPLSLDVLPRGADGAEVRLSLPLGPRPGTHGD
jgi:hypothetical protein